MPAACPANIREAKIAVGLKPQTDVVTPNLQADLWSFTKVNTALAVVEPRTETDALDIGKGDEFPTTVFKTSISTSMALEKYASSEFAAWLFAFALGSCAKTAAGTGWTYASTPQNPTTACINLPAFTYVEQIRQTPNAVVDWAPVGMVINDFTLNLETGPGRANCRLSCNCIGTGKLVNPSGYTIPAVTTEHSLNASGATVLTVNGIDYLAGTGIGRFNTLEFRWNNNLRADTGYYAGSGTQNGFGVRGRMEFGNREVTLNFVARAIAGSVEFNNLLGLVEGATTLTIGGAVIGAGPQTNGITLSFPRTIISSEVNGESDGVVTVNCGVTILMPVAGPPLCTLSATTPLNNVFGQLLTVEEEEHAGMHPDDMTKKAA